jgi:ubiquinone/menaquinone biosynthesis C-methylase UbiE
VGEPLGIGFFIDGLYDKVRPGYNTSLLVPEIKMLFPGTKPMVLAEFGAGSGAFTMIILNSGLPIEKLYIVDPDGKALEAHLEKFKNHSSFSKFAYVQGSSEKSTIREKTIDGILSAQSFHWFNEKETRSQWIRIGKPQTRIFILGRFPVPLNKTTKEFIKLTRFGKRPQGRKENLDAYSRENMTVFYGHFVERRLLCTEIESKELDAFIGEMSIRINTSCSEDVINQKEAVMKDASDFFKRHQVNGCIELFYQTFFICDTFS